MNTVLIIIICRNDVFKTPCTTPRRLRRSLSQGDLNSPTATLVNVESQSSLLTVPERPDMPVSAKNISDSKTLRTPDYPEIQQK